MHSSLIAFRPDIQENLYFPLAIQNQCPSRFIWAAVAADFFAAASFRTTPKVVAPHSAAAVAAVAVPAAAFDSLFAPVGFPKCPTLHHPDY